MRKQTSGSFGFFVEAANAAMLRTPPWLPSLLASFLIGGVLYGCLYALFSICFDEKELSQFHADRNSLASLVSNSGSLTRTALLRSTFTALFISAFFLALCGHASAQSVRSRITAEINTQERASLTGTHPSLARAEQDAGSVPSNKRLQGLTVELSRTATQEADLQTLMAAQQDSTSPLYHQWLTPDQFAERFGVADSDLAKIESWLQQEGFTITGTSRSKTRISFSGTVGQVGSAFDAQLHYYKSGSSTNFAPSTDISIPRALSSVVQGVSNLSTFRPKPHVRFKAGQRASSASANFTSSQSGDHYLSPADVVTMYDIRPAYSAGYTGTGQAIAVVGQSAIQLSDIENFQKASGLDVKDPTLVLGAELRKLHFLHWRR